MRSVDTLVIHHSACVEGSVPQFRKEHRAKGWNDIGYHGVIGNGKGQGDGVFVMGRPESVEGAGVFGNNRGKVHVCLVGNFHKADHGYGGPPTINQLRALGEWLLDRGKRYKKIGGAWPKVVGHREITIPGHGTACPGDTFPLELIRDWYRLRTMNAIQKDLAVFLHEKGYKYDNPPFRDQVVVVVDGRPLARTARIIDGMTYVPAMPLLNSLGYKGEWDGDTKELKVLPKEAAH